MKMYNKMSYSRKPKKAANKSDYAPKPMEGQKERRKPMSRGNVSVGVRAKQK